MCGDEGEGFFLRGFDEADDVVGAFGLDVVAVDIEFLEFVSEGFVVSFQGADYHADCHFAADDVLILV